MVLLEFMHFGGTACIFYSVKNIFLPLCVFPILVFIFKRLCLGIEFLDCGVYVYSMSPGIVKFLSKVFRPIYILTILDLFKFPFLHIPSSSNYCQTANLVGMKWCIIEVSFCIFFRLSFLSYIY